MATRQPVQQTSSSAAHAPQGTARPKASAPSTTAKPRGTSRPRESPGARPGDSPHRGKPEFGRRSSGHKIATATATDGAGVPSGRHGGGGGGSGRTRVQDAVPGNLRMVGDEETNAQASAALLARQQAEKERLAKAVAEAPTGYQTYMPRLTDLDIKSNWDRLLQSIHGEVDMSSLTACLARELDEDIPWNPAMLLVQLTSDMHDAAELTGEEVAFVPVDKSDIGLMTGGEVVRKRREKGPADESPAVPTTNKAAGAGGAFLAGLDAGPQGKGRAREAGGKGPSVTVTAPGAKEPPSPKRMPPRDASKERPPKRDANAPPRQGSASSRRSKESARQPKEAKEGAKVDRSTNEL